MNWDVFWGLLWSPALLSMPLLGLMIGAFYGYPLDRHRAARFPWTLYVIGMASIVAIAVPAIFGEEWRIEAQYVRAIFWTLLCASIPVGRWARMKYAEWNLGRKIQSKQEEVNGG